MLLGFLDMLPEEWTVRRSSNKGTKGIVGHLRRFEYHCGFFLVLYVSLQFHMLFTDSEALFREFECV